MCPQNSDLDHIRIHEGIDEILFGSKKDAVIKAIGTPPEENTHDNGDIELSYPSIGLSFDFWANFDFRLGRISSSRKSASLLGTNLIGSSKSTVTTFVSKDLNCEVTEQDGCIHESGEVQEWIFVDSQNLSFWFLNDTLESIEWTCLWADGEAPNWPQPEQ